MKKLLTTTLALTAMTTLAMATDCSTLSGCKKKICELETKAAMMTEPHAKARLEAALAETKANCSDEKLAAHNELKEEEHSMKTKHKIEEAQQDIEEYEVKKAKASAEGKADKVMKYKHKIEEKALKIKHLQNDM